MNDISESLYVIDAFRLIDHMHKHHPSLERLEMYIRNHMLPGSFNEPRKDFQERNTLYFHDQVCAEEAPPKCQKDRMDI